MVYTLIKLQPCWWIAMVDLSQEIKKVLGVETEYELACCCMDVFARAEENIRQNESREDGAITGGDMVSEIAKILKQNVSFSTYNLHHLREIVTSLLVNSITIPDDFGVVLMAVLPDINDESINKTIITPQGLFQFNKTQNKFECILDEKELEENGLSGLAVEAADAHEELILYLGDSDMKDINKKLIESIKLKNGHPYIIKDILAGPVASVVGALVIIIYDEMVDKIKKTGTEFKKIKQKQLERVDDVQRKVVENEIVEMDLLHEAFDDGDSYDKKARVCSGPLYFSEDDDVQDKIYHSKAWALINHAEKVIDEKRLVDEARNDVLEYVALLRKDFDPNESQKTGDVRRSKIDEGKRVIKNINKSQDNATILNANKFFLINIRKELEEERRAEKSVRVMVLLCIKYSAYVQEKIDEEPVAEAGELEAVGVHPLWGDRVAAVNSLTYVLQSETTSARQKLTKTRALLNDTQLKIIEKTDTNTDYFLKAIQDVLNKYFGHDTKYVVWQSKWKKLEKEAENEIENEIENNDEDESRRLSNN